jgi:hypothetical protein
MTILNDLKGSEITETISNYNSLLRFSLNNKNPQSTGEIIKLEHFETSNLFCFFYIFDNRSNTNSSFLIVEKIIHIYSQNILVVKILGKSYSGHDDYPEERNVYWSPCKDKNGQCFAINSDLFDKSFVKLCEIPCESFYVRGY